MPNLPIITARQPLPETVARLIAQGKDPLLARLYAARGIASVEDTRTDLGALAPPHLMLNIETMAHHLADAIEARRRLLIIADYDADGATACAVGLRALRAFGATVDYLVPDRLRFGYGLTPEIVELACGTKEPDILITVDNGIASIEGVTTANRMGLKVLVTDHHLPGPQLPAAWCIVNPNQPGCGFPSKNLAGVGVMFYLMLALRAELRQRGTLPVEPNLADLLDLVALGTVADVVKLDANNRILVHQGLLRMRACRLQPGVAALFQVARRDPRRATVSDLGFALAPRLNAAGRLSDMSLGIECLATDDPARAAEIAADLDRLNRERREIEARMQETALQAAAAIAPGRGHSLSLFNSDWHPGVVGIIAARIRERFHRPTIAFARNGPDELRGSGRSIPGLHLRDTLDLIAKRHPGLILKFGGHAAAAGLTLRASDFNRFAEAFETATRELVTAADLEEEIVTDGSLATADANLANAVLLQGQVWGAGFPEPQFMDTFEVLSQRVVGERHLRLRLARDRVPFEAMLFGSTPQLPPRIEAVYRLDVNDFNNTRATQLTVRHWVPASVINVRT